MTKYIYYCLTNLQKEIYATKKGGGVPHVHISSIENLKILVPPLEVQAEIVSIPDTFTALTAELALRKKQYEYYRDKLLIFENVEFKTISSVADSFTGLTYKPRDKSLFNAFDESFWRRNSYAKETNFDKKDSNVF